MWDQLDHADEYILYPENFGADMSLDETCLSNGDVYTILTNKATHGDKGTKGPFPSKSSWSKVAGDHVFDSGTARQQAVAVGVAE